MINEELLIHLKQSISSEFHGVDLGDDRRRDRLQQISQAKENNPELSFPRLFRNEAELEGAYRFFGNPDINSEEILDPHINRSIERLSKAAQGIAVHDTTEFSFSGEAERGIGRIRESGTEGFFGHFSLGIELAGGSFPLGVVNLIPYRRLNKIKGKRKSSVLRADKNKESLRWIHAVRNVENKVGIGKVIHVMDRESDSFELLAEKNNGARLVVRIAHDRRLADSDTKLFERLEQLTGVCEREVYISRRTTKVFAPKATRLHPARLARMARLVFSAVSVTLERSGHASKSLPPTLNINVVLVKEINPPEDCEPIEWRLHTTEPIDTTEQILDIVDIYRCRWLIEEYFKAIKTGCSYDKRQFENYYALLNVLALFVPIAWRLLLIRSVERLSPDMPANTIMTEDEINVLRRISKRPITNDPTISQILLAIAGLGGHLKRNGPPGWQTLWHGYQHLSAVLSGWTLAMRSANAING